MLIALQSRLKPLGRWVASLLAVTASENGSRALSTTFHKRGTASHPSLACAGDCGRSTRAVAGGSITKRSLGRCSGILTLKRDCGRTAALWQTWPESLLTPARVAWHRRPTLGVQTANVRSAAPNVPNAGCRPVAFVWLSGASDRSGLLANDHLERGFATLELAHFSAPGIFRSTRVLRCGRALRGQSPGTHCALSDAPCAGRPPGGSDRVATMPPVRTIMIGSSRRRSVAPR
ncbi:hypothetical protein ACVWXN_007289 [Bradyrhizobium sp. i1.4.4]